jgi:hypothetical protein
VYESPVHQVVRKTLQLKQSAILYHLDGLRAPCWPLSRRLITTARIEDTRTGIEERRANIQFHVSRLTSLYCSQAGI